MAGEMDEQSVATTAITRLVRVALALYLIPALLMVLVVGGCGMLILGTVRVLTTIVWGPVSWPSTPVGPTSFPADLRLDDR
jgi:hypothetical protein